MANIRNLKKGVNYVTSEIVIECLTYNYLFPQKSQEELASIISDSINLKTGLIKRINESKKRKKVEMKQNYRNIKNDFNNQVELLAKRLTKLNE